MSLLLVKMELKQAAELSTHRIIDLLKEQGGNFIVTRGGEQLCKKEDKDC